MRVLAIRLQNLNSLRGEHEARFDEEPLSTAGVFLITGPTGAGKSTLLDAMTLALYGRAARYGSDKADEMMSRHTAECFAEVDFETAGETLRAIWRLRRARGKVDGKLQPAERRLVNAVTGEILAEKAGEMDRIIEERTGLDAQRFLRSVLLAQGQFAAFLKAKPNERAELLEKITGTGIYRELSMLAYKTHQEKEEQVRQLKAALGAIRVLSDEERNAIEVVLKTTRAAVEQLNVEKEAAGVRLNAQREHVRIATELTQIGNTLRQRKVELATADEAATAAKAIAETARQQRAQREPVWEQAAALTAKSEQLEKQLTESRASYAVHHDACKQAVQRREMAEKALANHLNAAQVLEKWLQEHAADAGLRERLPAQRLAVREWRVVFEKLAEERKRYAEAADLKQRLIDGEAQVTALKQKVVNETAQEKLSRAEWEQLAKALEAQREVVRQSERVAGFEEHRHELKPGEACPLCGATEHPYVSAAVNAESQLQAARRLLTSLEKNHAGAQHKLNLHERELVKIGAELKGEAKRLEELQKRLVALEAPTDALITQRSEEELAKRVPLGTTPIEAERALDELQHRADTFAKRQQELEQKHREKQKLEGELLLAKQDESAKAQRLSELKDEGVKLRTQADALKAQLNELLGGQSLVEDRRQHEERLTAAEKSRHEQEARLNDLRTQIAADEAKLEQLETRRQPFVGQPVPSDEALSELANRVKHLNDEFAGKNAEIGDLQRQLINDENARQRRAAGGTELQAAEAESLRWGRLKELIGSADGAKFSRFAQSLSLRQLIGLANQHLQMLAERYRLIAAPGDELDLRIVDLFQAGVDRPMESLSGGESFLVSLALALGLSELASRHHPIDSLFIDEGFGALDAEALEIVMAALENLRARGKAIGVISHVEAMKERLVAQIWVQPLAGGVSQIKVCG